MVKHAATVQAESDASRGERQQLVPATGHKSSQAAVALNHASAKADPKLPEFATGTHGEGAGHGFVESLEVSAHVGMRLHERLLHPEQGGPEHPASVATTDNKFE